MEPLITAFGRGCLAYKKYYKFRRTLLPFFSYRSYASISSRQKRTNTEPPIVLNITKNKNLVSVRQSFSLTNGLRCYCSDSSKKCSLITGPISRIDRLSVFNYLYNIYKERFVINPQMDSEFKLKEFVKTSLDVVEVVSKYLSEADFLSLKGLVTDDCLTKLEDAISKMSLHDRINLKVDKDQIVYGGAANLQIIHKEESKTFMEIEMVYLIHKQTIQEGGNVNMFEIQQHVLEMKCCNYTFIREYTKGVTDQWTINLINHFNIF